uniref:Protein capI n=1 Tax=Arundo donax TaxID=35708 RepID=A0A0A9E877_ARUDO
MPPSRVGLALRRTSFSHAAPPYDDDTSRLRCDADECAAPRPSPAPPAERWKERERRDG